MQPAGQARRATIGYLVYKATTKTWFLKLSHDHVAEISIQGVTYVYLGPIKAFLLHVIFNAWHYHRFESFGQITVELHKKNSVERDKAFDYQVNLYTRYPIVARALGLAAALGRVRRASKGILHTTRQLEDHQDAYTR